MNYIIHNTIMNFIRSIADGVFRDVCDCGKYLDVILPMTIIRRLDAIPKPTKEAVLNMKKQLEGWVGNNDVTKPANKYTEEN